MAIAIVAWAQGFALAEATIGETAPPLVVQDSAGHQFDLSAERGKVTIVNFWATWCPPCRAEIPALEAVFHRYHDQGLEMIGVSADRPHEKSDVTKMAQSFGYPAAMLDDAESNGFGSPTELPITFIVDRNGVLRDQFTPDKGTLTEKSLTAAIVPLLAEPAPSNASSAAATPPKPKRKGFWKRLFSGGS
jgi:peroxiredoxin